MREIKFRGKRKDNGEWVYGYINYRGCVDNDTWYMYCRGSHIQVDPETVGQYTGLKDKNGKEIYEGDIVSNPVYFDKVREVCFNKIGTVSTIQDASQHSIGLLILERLEVIGNIHENPELLEEKP